MSYGRYAGEVQAAQERYDNRLASLQSSIRENDSRAENTHSECCEQQERIQRARQSELSKRDKYWNEQLALKEKQWAEKEAAVEKEMDAKIEQERQEKMKTEQRLKQEEQCVIMKQPREREQVELAERERYEAVRAARRAERHQYKPSLSTGIYGSYMLQKFPENSVSRKILHKFPEYSVSVQSGKFRSLESRAHHHHGHHPQHDDDEKMEQEEETDVLYQQMYAEHKKVDEEYKLEFKPECNVIGCCNQPEVDPKLLKGDMYICKAHRVEMVDQFRQSGLEGEQLKDVLDKFGSMSDAELLQHGEQMEADDYFLKNYTKAQHQRVQIAKKLSTLKRNSSEYWRLKLAHKRLQKCCDFFVTIRKICNPLLVILVAVAPIYMEELDIREYVRRQLERETKRKEEIAEALKLVDKFQDIVRDKEKMKNDCIMQRREAEKKYNDTEKKLEHRLQEIAEEQNKWNKKINDRDKKKEQEVKKEQTNQDEYIKKKEEEEKKLIKDAGKDEDKKINKQKDQWKQQKTSLDDALNQMRKDFEAAKKEAAGLDAEAAELEEKLADEDLDEAKAEKMMERWEKIENKKLERAKLEKEIKDKDSELKKKQKDHEDNMKKMEDAKKDRLDILRDLKKENMDRLEEQKKQALHSIKERFDFEIKELEQDKERKIGHLKTEKENLQEQLRDHQTTGKRELEQVKRDCERKERQYQREIDDGNFESAKARASALSRQTRSGRVALYVVWDSRAGFRYESSICDSSVDWKYTSYGNWWIAKFDGKYKRSGWNRIEFWTEGRYSYSYHYINNNYSISTYSNDTNVIVKL